MVKVSALIPAAGKGKRMGGDINKQFILLKDKTVLCHTLEVFDQHPAVSEIIVVSAEEELGLLQQELIQKGNFRKPIKLVAGGKERQDSVYNGLQAVEESGLIIIHDGARPFLTLELLNRVIIEAKKHDAVIVGMPVKDTIKVVDASNHITETPDRSKLWLVQTPQAFNYDLLRKAHQKAKSEGYYGTDDAMLIERLGTRVKMIEGSYENIKITTPEDLIIGEAILRRRFE